MKAENTVSKGSRICQLVSRRFDTIFIRRLMTVFWILNFFIGSAHAVKREVVVECGLPDKSTFVFTSKYEWSPLAKLARHASERSDQEEFTVVYRGTKWKTSKNLEDLSAYSSYESDPKSLCGFTGMFQGVPYGFTNDVSVTILFPQTGQFKFISFPENFPTHFDSRYPTTSLHSKVAELDVVIPVEPSLRAGFIETKLVLEQALVAHKLPCKNDTTACKPAVKAVQRVESNDGGVTWTMPVISTEPKLFSLNRTMNDQFGIGQLLKVNGKLFQETR